MFVQFLKAKSDSFGSLGAEERSCKHNIDIFQPDTANYLTSYRTIRIFHSSLDRLLCNTIIIHFSLIRNVSIQLKSMPQRITTGVVNCVIKRLTGPLILIVGHFAEPLKHWPLSPEVNDSRTG